MLNILGSHGYNMRSLHSRPMKNLQWNYYFYIEAEGNVNNQNGRDMLQEMNAVCAQLKLEVEDGAEAGSDLVFVNLEVRDAEGRFVPDAAVDVTFAVKGPCEIIATDNGDEADFASFHSPTRRTFSGRLQAIVRLNPSAAGASITAAASGLNPCEIPVRR